MTKFQLIQDSTGHWQLPAHISQAIATAVVSGYRVDVRVFDAGVHTDPKTRTGVVDVLSPVTGLVPNAETIEAMRAAERGEFVGEYKTVDEFMAALDADD
jgi:hypothetical protein